MALPTLPSLLRKKKSEAKEKGIKKPSAPKEKKRGLSAYNVYVREQSEKMKKSKETQPQKMKKIGESWSKLSPKQKAKYQKEADALNNKASKPAAKAPKPAPKKASKPASNKASKKASKPASKPASNKVSKPASNKVSKASQRK